MSPYITLAPPVAGQGLASLVLAMLMLLGAACRRTPAPTPPTPTGAVCRALPGGGTRIDSATVVLTWTLDPANHARPTNPGERFVVGQAYEPLVGTDCRGRLTLRLAKAWTVLDGGRRVRLTLRDNARFWSGDPATAPAVLAGWNRVAQTPSAALARRVARTAAVVDDSTLEIDCNPAREQVIGARVGVATPVRCAVLASLGDPELAVMRSAEASGWPEGTRYRIRDAGVSQSGTRRILVLEPADTTTDARLLIHAVGGADARDLIDAGVDLLLTDDPALASYAATRAGVASLELAWDRTWVVMTPAPPSTPPESVMTRTATLRDELARDAVRADARVADWPDWFRDLRTCALAVESQQATYETPRIVVSQSEPTARGIAERLVALAAGGSNQRQDSLLAVLAPQVRALGRRMTAAVVSPNDFWPALRGGSDVAYVLPLPRRSLAPCLEAERLAAMAPWLVPNGGARRMTPHVVPLIDTRLRAVARRDWLALTMTWDSTVVISRP